MLPVVLVFYIERYNIDALGLAVSVILVKMALQAPIFTKN